MAFGRPRRVDLNQLPADYEIAGRLPGPQLHVQNARDRRRGPRRDGAADHRPQAHLGEIAFAPGRDRRDTTDLDADRGEVGEAAQCVGRDDLRPLAENALFQIGAELAVGDELVERQLDAEEVADRRGVAPERLTMCLKFQLTKRVHPGRGSREGTRRRIRLTRREID